MAHSLELLYLRSIGVQEDMLKHAPCGRGYAGIPACDASGRRAKMTIHSLIRDHSDRPAVFFIRKIRLIDLPNLRLMFTRKNSLILKFGKTINTFAQEDAESVSSW